MRAKLRVSSSTAVWLSCTQKTGILHTSSVTTTEMTFMSSFGIYPGDATNQAVTLSLRSRLATTRRKNANLSKPRTFVVVVSSEYELNRQMPPGSKIAASPGRRQPPPREWSRVFYEHPASPGFTGPPFCPNHSGQSSGVKSMRWSHRELRSHRALPPFIKSTSPAPGWSSKYDDDGNLVPLTIERVYAMRLTDRLRRIQCQTDRLTPSRDALGVAP